MKSDLEIAQSAHLEKIEDVAKKINVTEDALINFGPYMAKINSKELGHKRKKEGKVNSSDCNESNTGRVRVRQQQLSV
jgi:formate--tetrahydrofolate ligase